MYGRKKQSALKNSNEENSEDIASVVKRTEKEVVGRNIKYAKSHIAYYVCQVANTLENRVRPQFTRIGSSREAELHKSIQPLISTP